MPRATQGSCFAHPNSRYDPRLRLPPHAQARLAPPTVHAHRAWPPLLGVPGQEAKLRSRLVLAATCPDDIHRPSGDRNHTEGMGLSLLEETKNDRNVNISSSPFPLPGKRKESEGNHRGERSERLAAYLADRLDDWKSHRFFLSITKRVPREVVLDCARECSSTSRGRTSALARRVLHHHHSSAPHGSRTALNPFIPHPMPTRLPPRREPRVLARARGPTCVFWAVADPWELRGPGPAQTARRAPKRPPSVASFAARSRRWSRPLGARRQGRASLARAAHVPFVAPPARIRPRSSPGAVPGAAALRPGATFERVAPLAIAVVLHSPIPLDPMHLTATEPLLAPPDLRRSP